MLRGEVFQPIWVRPLMLQQIVLVVSAAKGVVADMPIGAYHPVARNDKWDRVPGDG